MDTPVLRLAAACLIASSAAMLPALPAAAAYPDKPVTVVVGYGPGGGADTLARLYAEKLSAELGRPFVVENKPGAGATLAAGEVARAAPDGYTLMVAPTAVFTITPNVRKVNYAPLKDFTPISTLATGMDVVIASKALPAASLPEFIALAKAHPGKYSFASSGLATSTHLMGEVFKEASGLDMLHVPYKSSNDYLPDLIEGRVALAFDPVLLNQVQAGKLRFMAVVGDDRLEDRPDVGTTREAGLDMTLAQNRLWYGIFAPAGLPPDIAARLAAAVGKASADPELAKRLEATGIRPSHTNGEAFATQIRNDADYYGGLIGKLGLKLAD